MPILVVGAGPAGATASLTLSKLQLPHLVIDQATFPRDKVCGDGLDLKIPRILRHLNPDWASELLQQPNDFLQCWGVRLASPKNKYYDSIYEPKQHELAYPPFVTAKRYVFDNFLINKMSSPFCEFKQQATLKSLRKTPEGFEADILHADQLQTVHCKLLLAADGDHSTILRHLNERKINRQHYASSLRVYYKGIEGFHEKNLIEAHFRKQLPVGYFWMFPLPNGEANVGLGIQSDVASRLKINLNQVLEKLIKEEPDLKERFRNAEPIDQVRGWGIPLASVQRRVVGDNYLLLGDAASIVNPLNGEGIGTAMFSGYIAAMYAQRAVANNNFSAAAMQNYQQEVSARLKSEINLYNSALKYGSQSWSAPLLNLLFATGVPQKIMRDSMSEWIKTAYQRDIKLSL